MENIDLQSNSINSKLGLYALKNSNEILFNIALAPNHSEALHLYSESLTFILKEYFDSVKANNDTFKDLSSIVDMILTSSVVVVGSLDIVSHDLENIYSVLVDDLSTIIDSDLLSDVLVYIQNTCEVNSNGI